MKRLFEKTWNDKIVIVDYLETFYYNVKHGCINIIQWLPIVWKDRDYDHYFLMRLLEFKLNKMGKSFKRYNNHSETNKHVKQVTKCANLFKKLYEDEYHTEAFKEHDKKWGELNLSFEDCEYEDLCELIFDRKNIKSKEDEINEERESKQNILKSYENKERDLKEVFREMQDNILTWWD